MEEIETKPKRRYDIDWLRALAVFLLIFFHTARIFDSLSPFYIKNEKLGFFYDNFVFLVDQWILPILFLIAGAATWFSLEYRTKKEYLKERFMRPVVPFIFGVLVIVPPQLYYVLRTNLNYQGSYWHFYSSYFSNINYQYPLGGDYSGTFEFAHLWFLIILFIFSLILLPLFLHLKTSKGGKLLISKTASFCGKRGMIFLSAVPLIVVELTFRALTKWSFFQNPVLYFVFFIYGFFIFSDGRIEEAIQKYGKIAFAGAIICTLIIFSMNWRGLSFFEGNQNFFSYNSAEKYLFEILRGFNMWLWMIFFLYFSKKYLSFSNKFLKYSNNLVLPFYILHQTVIVSTGYYIAQWSVGIMAKYLLISMTSLLVTIIIYNLFVKRTNITRFLFGMRLLRKKKE